MSQKDIGNKIPIYKLKAGKEVEDYYDEWTVENKYDKDMVDWKYSGPQETVALFTKHIPSKDIKILDAGCGTGLVGIELKKNGFQNFDGADFSQKMLDLVPENIYQNLFKIDLNKKIDIKDNTYVVRGQSLFAKTITRTPPRLKFVRLVLRGFPSVFGGI